MRDFAIVTDSCCDLTAALAEELSLTVLPLSFHIGDQDCRNWLDGRDMDFHQFYEKIRRGTPATTSVLGWRAAGALRW